MIDFAPTFQQRLSEFTAGSGPGQIRFSIPLLWLPIDFTKPYFNLVTWHDAAPVRSYAKALAKQIGVPYEQYSW